MKKITLLVAALCATMMMNGQVTEMTVNAGAGDYYGEVAAGVHLYQFQLVNQNEAYELFAPYLILTCYMPSGTSIAGTVSIATGTIDPAYCMAWLTDEEAADDNAEGHAITAAEMTLTPIQKHPTIAGVWAYYAEVSFTSEGQDYHVTGALYLPVSDYNTGDYVVIDESEDGDATAIDMIEIDNSVYARDGRIYAEEGARIYNLVGLDVTEMNGNLNGVFVVRNGNKVAKVLVTK